MLLYSNNYVILVDNELSGYIPRDIIDLPGDSTNIIDDTIYLGIGTGFADASYDILLVQNLSDDYFDPNSGYIEEEYDISINFRYLGPNSLTSRTVFVDPRLPPILSWNGMIRIGPIQSSQDWVDASSIRLQLNNRRVTCYFVKYPFGNSNDTIIGDIFDPGLGYV